MTVIDKQHPNLFSAVGGVISIALAVVLLFFSIGRYVRTEEEGRRANLMSAVLAGGRGEADLMVKAKARAQLAAAEKAGEIEPDTRLVKHTARVSSRGTKKTVVKTSSAGKVGRPVLRVEPAEDWREEMVRELLGEASLIAPDTDDAVDYLVEIGSYQAFAEDFDGQRRSFDLAMNEAFAEDSRVAQSKSLMAISKGQTQ
ncbi:MAG: hypothetical protein ACI9MB_005166, partial [Verrucomicrobiales bacterium]